MAIKHEANSPMQGSHLFVVRLWPEDVGEGLIDWRGKVQHVNSGEVRYFRDWPTLEVFVDKLLGRSDPDGSHAGIDEDTGKEPQ